MSTAYGVIQQENVNVRTHRIVLLAGLLALTACGSGEPAAEPSDPPTAARTAAGDARAQLAALAAAAKDRRLTALYTLSTPGRADRTVALTSAIDGSWRVDVPLAALGGTADVSVAKNRDGLFQCTLASAGRAVQPTCVRVAAANGRIAAANDPRVQHPFTDWREVLTDRDAALSVSTTEALPGARGACFSVESTTASLNAPLDVGIYCYESDGTLTAARLSFGTLLLSGAPTAAPAAITLPGPVVDQAPLGMAAPPTPTPTPSATPSG